MQPLVARTVFTSKSADHLDSGVLNLHEDLIAKCLNGNREAQYDLYKLYARAMYNVSFRIVGDEMEAEDALQEAFISAFNHLQSYRGDASFGAWLKRIVINKSINALQKKRHASLPEDDSWDYAEEDPLELDDLTVEKVKRAIQSLPDGYRTVLSLYLLEGYDHQEIAEIMGISTSTSKSQLNRAKAKLRNLLEGKNKTEL